MKLYLNERPRTFVLVSNDSALIVRHPSPTYGKESHSHLSRQNPSNNKNDHTLTKVIVEFVKRDLVDLSRFQELSPSSTLICLLGFFNMKGKVYIAFITKSKKVATPKLGENISAIEAVAFYCLNTDEHDHMLFTEQQEEEKSSNDYPSASMRRFLCNGDFFYSTDFDITSTLQARGFYEKRGDFDRNENTYKLFADSPYFKRFSWNKFLNSELIQFRNRLTPEETLSFDKSGFLVNITRGYAKTVNASIKTKDDALLTLINKQSCKKNGPLFGEWGSDDKGAVSNFQESEIIIYTEYFCFSYTIVKGNVPIFWEVETHFHKKNLISRSGGKEISLTRSFDTSQHAFKRHMDQLMNQFGDVHIIKSIPLDPSNFKSSLGEALEQHIEYFNKQMAKAERNEPKEYEKEQALDPEIEEDKNRFIYFLNHTDIPLSSSTIKKNGYTGANPNNLVQLVVEPMVELGALFYDFTSKSYIGKQLGVFRITTYDSLSKANFLSKIICQEVIQLAFRDIGIIPGDDLLNKHAKLWKECNEFINKNILSFISYSTKLQKSSQASKKKNIKSQVSKRYLNSVIDPKVNETALLKLLGRLQDQTSVIIHNPIHDYIMKELQKNAKLYTSSKEINLFASTFNVNGTMYKGDIKDWLFPPGYDSMPYDLVFIGIQEIIELTASKMVNVDSVNRQFWENHIKWHLNELNPDKIKYMSLWSGQLGGLSLFVFIKSTEISKISQLESSIKKTGFRGVSANKGGIAVRFKYESTEVCLITSHLAAGLTNSDERHHDYKVISKGIKFSRNKRIKDHDVAIWLGDLNYRINLSNEQAKLLIEQKDYAKLFEFDQLNLQMANGESFPFFDEPEIRFPPTYKFDNNTKEYDTSEKQRIPAWTDRILYMSRPNLIKPVLYDCVEDIIFSDHRPVLANFKIKINIENETVKKNLSSEIYDNYITKFGEINDLFINNNNLTYLVDLDANVLPPPSSDSNKWWLVGGLPAKVTIQELNKTNMVINPRCPKNPFKKTEEPEFIQKALLNS
ncbi:inositol-1 [Yamadazyma tenuis]|uniref:phosphoinositide 5-phosphatase n=1 Tax=Candida tenuis (strain ATCC 10573 / BCRC 21748 / CBS 615 / JCM 9827 / NBRC 10315 / NRRL Y-1498 / VKM Y-70) TaxID=590646 RepID=G3B1V4_CANTC|nr:DNase I-like protein [Yamadazyma tenuis ATCC 10573]EGV64538.1 DNase I-like protein [Yamadazyma tenuis ATCC 10573]WEJ97304.1 inositol-1 [Yamadazyma tenuis]